MSYASRITFGFIVLLSVSSSVSTADERTAKKRRNVPDQVVAYKTVPQADGTTDELDLHIFHPPGYQTTGKLPCVVFFFGGGWNGGTPTQFHPHCEYFASRGMVAISAEYRTKKSHKVEPKACVLDGKSAVRWVRENAQKLGIDPERVAVGGGSAGGHVAAAVAACQELEETPQSETNCIPNALVLFNPVYDNGPQGYGHERVKDYWQDFSPMHNLHKGMPPTIAFFGANDKLIPVATTKAFATEMKKVGVRYENHVYDDQAHGFFNFGRSKNGTDYFVETVRESDLFLKSIGMLEGEPTVEAFVAAQRSSD